VQPISGAPGITIANVDTALAAFGSAVLFTDNRSDPTAYPVLADMKVLNAANYTAHALEAGIVDGRTIQIRSDKTVVVYQRDGDAVTGGIWMRPIL
jgi:hypothetical protein